MAAEFDLLSYGIKAGTTSPTLVDKVSDVLIYQSFGLVDKDGKEPLVKIETTGTVIAFSKAYDKWGNRSSAIYTRLRQGR